MYPACLGIPANAACSQPEHLHTVEWSENKWCRGRRKRRGGEERRGEEERRGGEERRGEERRGGGGGREEEERKRRSRTDYRR